MRRNIRKIMEGKWMWMEQEKARGFVDIHTHILPGVDDGAKDLADALNLLHMARKNGTTDVILTPHYRGKFRKNTPEQLRACFETLNAEVRRSIPDMNLYLGNEAAMDRELGEKIAEGRVLSINDSRYVLLEFDYSCAYIRMMDGVMNVFSCGYIPIIAHAERYDILRKNKRLIDEILQLGALVQINADSVLGKAGLGTKWYCRRLLGQGKVHFIASDAHDEQERTPVLGECFQYVSKRYGEDYAWALFRDNAQALLLGQ